MRLHQKRSLRQIPGSSHAQDSESPSFTFSSRSIANERHHERNEDSLIADRRSRLAAVFDGVGGSLAGEVASQLAAKVIRRGWRQILEQLRPGAPASLLESDALFELRSALLALVEEAHEQIRAEGAQPTPERGLRTGTEDQATTLALAVFCQHQDRRAYTMIYTWVGDSRIYLLRAGKMCICLTQDDSYLRKLVQEQVISESEALRIEQAVYREELSPRELTYFDKRNGITQALGDPEPPVIHLDQIAIEPGDRILLCTDGIHDNLTDRQIEEVLRSAASTTAARVLVELAAQYACQETSVLMRAKPDDMSAVVVTCHGSSFPVGERLRV